MQFEKTDNKETPYQFIFEGDEIEVAGAVFMEQITLNFRSGNPGSVSDFDYYVANWDEDSSGIAPISSFDDFVEVFENFAERTEGMQQEISLESAEPAFANKDILYRRWLGDRALELATEIRRHALAAHQPQKTSLSEESIRRDVAGMDTHLSELLKAKEGSQANENT